MPLEVLTMHEKPPPQKKLPYITHIAFLLHEQTIFWCNILRMELCFEWGLICKATQCYDNIILSIFLCCYVLILYIREEGKRPSVVFGFFLLFFLHSTWRLWHWQSSAATHHKELDFIGRALKYSCWRHARNWNEEYFLPRSERAEPLYPSLLGCRATWPCFQTTFLLNVRLL